MIGGNSWNIQSCETTCSWSPKGLPTPLLAYKSNIWSLQSRLHRRTHRTYVASSGCGFTSLCTIPMEWQYLCPGRYFISAQSIFKGHDVWNSKKDKTPEFKIMNICETYHQKEQQNCELCLIWKEFLSVISIWSQFITGKSPVGTAKHWAFAQQRIAPFSPADDPRGFPSPGLTESVWKTDKERAGCSPCSKIHPKQVCMLLYSVVYIYIYITW